MAAITGYSFSIQTHSGLPQHDCRQHVQNRARGSDLVSSSCGGLPIVDMFTRIVHVSIFVATSTVQWMLCHNLWQGRYICMLHVRQLPWEDVVNFRLWFLIPNTCISNFRAPAVTLCFNPEFI